MCKTKDGRYKFNFLEMICSGKTGETSATGFSGLVMISVGMLMFVAMVIFYFCNIDEASNILDLLDRVTVVMGLGAALLGTRKISGAIASTRGAKAIDMVEHAVSGKQDHVIDDLPVPSESETTVEEG